MMRLENIFRQVFDDTLVNDDRLIKYAEVALARLQQNNADGKFTDLIPALRSALENFKNAVASKKTLVAQREGSTKGVDELIAEFKKKALQREGLIRDIFGVDSPAYQEFYPLGTSEYTRMTKTNADQLMRRMLTAYINNADKLPEERRLEIEKLYTDYTTARATQLEKAAGISNKQVEKTQGRAALEIQLQYNLLTIAREFIGKTEMYSTYFEHNLLFPYRHKSLERDGGGEEDEESGSYVMTLQPMSTRKAEFSISADDTLNLYNSGDTPLSVYVATTADAPVPAGALYLEPESEEVIAVTDLGPAGSTFLLVNNNTSEEGSIEIAMI